MKRSAAEAPIRLGAAADLSKPNSKRRPLRWFIAVPARMALDSGVSSTAFRLAALLLHYEGHLGCFPAQSRLAEDLGISVDSVQRYIRELELYGFLKRSKRGKRNQYELLPLYEPPLGHGSIEETGQLEVENLSKRRPPAPRTLHRRRLDPPPPPLAAPVRSIEPRTSLQRAAPVRPITELVGHDPDPLAAPVRPIATSQPYRQPGGPRIVAEQQSAPLRPHKAASVQLDEQNAPHPCGTINNLETNNQHHQDAGVADFEPDDETTTIDDALAQLQRVKVNLGVSDLGVHFGRGRRLAPKELTAWAQWVKERSHASILNKCAFAAAKIRMGCTLDDVLPEAIAARQSGTDALQSLAPDLRAMLVETIRNGTRFDARWLRERDIPPEAVVRARERIAANAAAEISETPLCDTLSASDPVEYRARLQSILDVLEIPKIASSRRSLDHPMFLGMCRARLESQLAVERAD